MKRFQSVCALLVAVFAVTAGPAPAAESGAEPAVKPADIWPAGLEKLAGRYLFLQVASPGGLWERFTPANPRLKPTDRQVSINEVPAALRDRLTRAEIIISGVQAPTLVEASEKTSPSGRGKLRFYNESAIGHLEMRNLPGIGDREEQTGDFKGKVRFELLHGAHSNPTISGVQTLRLQQEMIWGAATLDFADLAAFVGTEATAEKHQHEEDEEDEGVIANARVLRSGVEIFAYVAWTEKADDGERSYTGSIRLIRDDQITPPRPAGPEL